MIGWPANKPHPKEWYAAYNYLPGPAGSRRMVVMAYVKARDPGTAWRGVRDDKRFRCLPWWEKPVAVLRARHVPKTAKGRRELS
jgi:hypothetical protein